MSEPVIYVYEIKCNHAPHCGETSLVAVEGPPVPIDQEAPAPTVDHCPACSRLVFLERDVREVREARVIDPDTREATEDVEPDLGELFAGDGPRMLPDFTEDALGTRDLDEAERRLAVLRAWREENGEGSVGGTPPENESGDA